jgi:signal transduction histidine kinase
VNLIAFPSSRMQAERSIAVIRVVLGASSLLAVWLDPVLPGRDAQTIYILYAFFLAYAALVATAVYLRPPGPRLPVATHLIDIIVFSVFQYLTLGPSSPFFVYFAFSVICGGMRWGSRGTLWTAGFVLTAYVVMTISMSRTFGPGEFELNRFVIRLMYLVLSTVLLVYLGRYQERLHGEMQQLAHWPSPSGIDVERIVEQVLEHASEIVGSKRAIAVWEAGEEPSVQVASWSSEGSSLTRHAPHALTPIVAPPFEDTTFLCPRHLEIGALVSVRKGELVLAPDLRIHSRLHSRVHGTRLLSAAFKTERVRGRVFFMEVGTVTPESVPLAEVVAREIGGSLDQLHVARQLRDIAAGEERIRLARDLHDGVLQSLTGIRLELRAAATSLEGPSARDRLLAIERALAIEQRELRLFIGGLKPGPVVRPNPSSLAGRLEELRERVEMEWKAPVTLRIAADAEVLPDRLEQAVPLMVHESIVNALKHGRPSRVTVAIDRTAAGLRVVVSDDGTGFSFRGRYEHEALAQSEETPRSLLDRVIALGGRLTIDSSDAGARIEMLLPCSDLMPWPSVLR